jgi:hypothetical protein
MAPPQAVVKAAVKADAMAGPLGWSVLMMAAL